MFVGWGKLMTVRRHIALPALLAAFAVTLSLGAVSGAAQAQITPVAPVQAAPQQTLDGAHTFLTQILGNGAASMDVRAANNINIFIGWVTIDTIYSYRCATSLYGRQSNGDPIYRHIDWTQVQNVDWDAGGVAITGAIETTKGAIVPRVIVRIADADTGYRVIKAGLFLRDQCNTSHSTGF